MLRNVLLPCFLTNPKTTSLGVAPPINQQLRKCPTAGSYQDVFLNRVSLPSGNSSSCQADTELASTKPKYSDHRGTREMFDTSAHIGWSTACTHHTIKHYSVLWLYLYSLLSLFDLHPRQLICQFVLQDT